MKAYVRALEILRPYTAQRAIKTEGHFAVNDNNTYNTVTDNRSNPDNLLRNVYRIYRDELEASPEVLDAVIELVETMRPNEVNITADLLKKPFSK